MIVDILTLFPEMFEGIITNSIIKRAMGNDIIQINIHNFRDYSKNKNKKVDDYAYGGGAGMLIALDPIVSCLRNIPGYERAKKIITSAQGKKYTQKVAQDFSNEKHIIIVCGHYEGVDERINNYIDEKISIGDYILTGGEIAALVIIDSIVRLLPGALGNSESAKEESYSGCLLEYPQYTRPEEYEGYRVPDELLSGHHENIRKYRRFKSLENTYHNRPDLLKDANLTSEDESFLKLIKTGKTS